ncbi:PACE efflux transporter [Gilvimarinus agarilyticus]|uniref:PACE efflux transporter n=1 Tax=Gilvimarinus agarilyticus TaxID=679259 RepID=UPI000697D98E|nr:PACE efflux transporter [Gilvimarinus agarilyticus]
MSTLERMVHAFLYEFLALVLTIIGLLLFTQYGPGAVFGSMLAISLVALVYNFYFNILFDRWFPGPRAQRGLWVRVLYTCLFDVCLLALTTPMVAMILNVGLLEALLLDVWVTLFVMGYTFAFNVAYDALRPMWLSETDTGTGTAAGRGEVAYG